MFTGINAHTHTHTASQGGNGAVLCPKMVNTADNRFEYCTVKLIEQSEQANEY